MGNTPHFARKTFALSAISVAACIMSSHVLAACPLPTQLQADDVTKAFRQEKTLTGMTRPLVSEGMLSAQGDEVVWHMMSPFDVKTVINKAGVSQSVDGEVPVTVSGGAGQLGASIASSMASMMRGDWDGLNSMFNVTTTPSAGLDDWHVELVPRDDRLTEVLGTIRVSGCEDVAHVLIMHPGGDKETIDFTDPVPVSGIPETL